VFFTEKFSEKVVPTFCRFPYTLFHSI